MNHSRILLHDLPIAGNAELPGRPIGITVLTSLRDVVGDDRNGQWIETPMGARRMIGAVEHLAVSTWPGGALHNLARLAAVIVDDMPSDFQRLHMRFPITPCAGEPWIHPLDLLTADGEPVAGRRITHALPSRFRRLPLNARAERFAAKAEFERQVIQIMRDCGADILITDHYMARLEFIIGEDAGRFGKVLNIHPAITAPESPFCLPGPTPTRDALRLARAGRNVRLGATLHFTTAEFDAGPIIASSSATVVHPHDEPIGLKYRNYQVAKLPVLIAGLRHFLTRIYPRLQNEMIPALTPVRNVA